MANEKKIDDRKLALIDAALNAIAFHSRELLGVELPEQFAPSMRTLVHALDNRRSEIEAFINAAAGK